MQTQNQKIETADTRLEDRTLEFPIQDLCIKYNYLDYGQGFGEISWGIITQPKKLKRPKGKSDAMEANQLRAARRAKSMVRKSIMTIDADRFITLTYRENKTDLDECWKDFKKFNNLCREHFQDWKYVCVPERQQRGAVHFHFAVRGYKDVTVLRRFWHQVVGVDQGNVDIKYFKPNKYSKKSCGIWPRERIASYISKYIVKDLENGWGLNKKRYSRSEGILLPQTSETLISVSLGTAIDWFLRILRDDQGKVGFQWYGENNDGHHGWMCSWGPSSKTN